MIRKQNELRWPKVERRIVIACSLTSNSFARYVTWLSRRELVRRALIRASNNLVGISRQAANWLASISLGSTPVLDLELRGVMTWP